ncbi:MAG TPA: AmmeMemoRadiSam system protein B [Ignavibacteriales bacterium]|nr:AmmeMemoRadiSam system protein B [Ignavibacteriales bacterium]
MIRPVAVEGAFYRPRNILKNDLDNYFNSAEISFSPSKILGIVAPHAGYVYSGKTAAYAYKYLIGRKYKTVIVLSPSHYDYFEFASVFNGDFYEAPFGNLALDKELIEKLVANSNVLRKSHHGHMVEEHALEVQLPFLQYVLGEFKLVPIVLGSQNRDIVYNLAQDLSKIVNDDILIVVSTDLSHFYNRKQAEILDDFFDLYLSNWDADGLQLSLEYKRCEACGGGCVVTLLKALENNKNAKIQVVNRSYSSDTNHDTSRVVGYLSAIIYE